MPEGDSIASIASILGPALVGRTLDLVRARGRDWSHLAGRVVTGVRRKGKHLYLDLDAGLCLRSHLGLYGSWHRYGRGEPWLRPERQASLVLAVGAQVYVCFNARELDLGRIQGFTAQDQLNRLGPDLVSDAVDGLGIGRRAQALVSADTLVVDLLLDQRVACGIGNVYKSEVLFLNRRPPSLRLGDLDGADLAALYETAGELLWRNRAGGPRVTRTVADGRGRLWVYGRADLPCLHCGGMIRRGRLGRNPRSTYWCSVCQA